MEKATSYLISLGIISFGAWITAVETGSPSFATWLGVSAIPVSIGLLSLYGEL